MIPGQAKLLRLDTQHGPEGGGAKSARHQADSAAHKPPLLRAVRPCGLGPLSAFFQIALSLRLTDEVVPAVTAFGVAWIDDTATGALHRHAYFTLALSAASGSI